MIDSALVESLLLHVESPVLEFKREWYWLSDDDAEPRDKHWGEFYKDVISLCNAYLDYVGQDRYLIFGFCESTKEQFNLDSSKINILQNIQGFRKKIISRLETLLNYPPLDMEIDFVELQGKRLLVIKIPSPRRLIELKSELSTKSRVLDAGAVLVRKGQDNDSIRVAGPQEILELTLQFDKYKNQLESQPIEITKKHRSIYKTVQLYIEKNSSWSIDVGYPIVNKDWNNNIIFELFKISESLGGSKYFLYLHEHSVQGKTNAYIKQNNYIDNAFPLIILTDSPSIKDKQRRKENISQIFKSAHVFFIEEFGLNYLYGDFIKTYERYNLPIFVESLTNEINEGHNSALKVLDAWYACPASPLMVIKGYGGIGKTTLAKQFLDNINKTDDGVGLMFIDSTEIIDGLLRASRAEKKIDDLYDFYTASQREEIVAKSFSKDLLKLSVDNGSLVIVLDGIDEVIAKLGSKFDVASFVSSIIGSYSDNVERGKIVITCRDNFWRDVDSKGEVKEINLLPFNEKLAQDFFQQAFGDVRAKVSRAMEMADRLALKQVSIEATEAIYIPYVLDLIVYLLKHEEEFGDADLQLVTASKLLNLNVSNDFLVGSVCGREIKKLNNYDIDAQINFLIDFSVSKSGYMSLYDVKRDFEGSTGIQVSDEFVEKLTGHPLLSCADNKLYFRYDFFYDYFKALCIVRYFTKRDVAGLKEDVIDVLNTYVGYDNEFSRSIANRITFSEDFVVHSLETVETLKERLSSATAGDVLVLRGAISGALSLLLTVKKYQYGSLDVASGTEMLKALFFSDGYFDGLNIINLSSSDKTKPIFDFRGAIVRNSYFENYEFFWECPMDEATRFQSSTFISLEPRKGVRINTFPNTFDSSCDVSDISVYIQQRSKEANNEREDIKTKLTQFFKLFHEQGNFYPKRQEDVRARVYTGALLPILLKNKVVIDYKDPKKAALKQYKIADAYRPIIKIFEQGGEATLEFERVINMFI